MKNSERIFLPFQILTRVLKSEKAVQSCLLLFSATLPFRKQKILPLIIFLRLFFHLSMQRNFLKNVLKRTVSAKCTSRLTRECQESALCVRNFHGMNILLKKFVRLAACLILRLRDFLLIFVCLMKMPRAESSQTSSMKTLFMCVTALKGEALISALFIAQTAEQLKITPKPVAIW